MIVYLLIDISASMTGAKMASLNDAMENLVGELQNYDSARQPISLMVLLYSRDVKWLSENPMPLSEFTWEKLTPYGMTAMGIACKTLSMSINNERSIAILMTDGYPTDDFESGIRDLEGSPYINNCTRLAVAIGDDADIDSLKRFVGFSDRVYSINSMDKLFFTLSTILQSSILKSTNTNNQTMDDEWD